MCDREDLLRIARAVDGWIARALRLKLELEAARKAGAVEAAAPNDNRRY